jgi:hypothetical protein
MNTVKIINVSPSELEQLITKVFQTQFSEFKLSKVENEETTEPHLTRIGTAKFFDISLGCVNDWCNKGIITPYKVGQRTYFKRSELMHVLFNQPKRA